MIAKSRTSMTFKNPTIPSCERGLPPEDINVIEKIFGSSIHLRLLLLYYNNGNSFANLAGLSAILGKTRGTIRKVVNDLEDVHILMEVYIGSSKVIQKDESGPYTKTVFEFIGDIRINAVKEGGMKLIE